MANAGAFEYEETNRAKPLDLAGTSDTKEDLQGIVTPEDEVYHLLMLGSPIDKKTGKIDTRLVFIKVLTGPKDSDLIGKIMPLPMSEYRDLRGDPRPSEDSALDFKALSEHEVRRLRSYESHFLLRSNYDEWQDALKSRNSR